MAKAGLPEAQSPDDATSHRPERRLNRRCVLPRRRSTTGATSGSPSDSQRGHPQYRCERVSQACRDSGRVPPATRSVAHQAVPNLPLDCRARTAARPASTWSPCGPSWPIRSVACSRARWPCRADGGVSAHCEALAGRTRRGSRSAPLIVQIRTHRRHSAWRRFAPGVGGDADLASRRDLVAGRRVMLTSRPLRARSSGVFARAGPARRTSADRSGRRRARQCRLLPGRVTGTGTCR